MTKIENRKNETPGERRIRIEKAKLRKAKPKSLYAARNALNVLNGHQIVLELKKTEEILVPWTQSAYTVVL